MVAWIYLVNVNGPNLPIDTLISNAACYNSIEFGQQMAAIIYLLA